LQEFVAKVHAQTLITHWEQYLNPAPQINPEIFKDQVLYSRQVSTWGNGNFALKMELERERGEKKIWLRKFQKVGGEMQASQSVSQSRY
jgi:hypothetical protein